MNYTNTGCGLMQKQNKEQHSIGAVYYDMCCGLMQKQNKEQLKIMGKDNLQVVV